MRVVGSAMVLAAWLLSARVHAQRIEPWSPPLAETSNTRQESPSELADRIAASRARRDAIVGAGAILASVAYAGAIAWGAHYRSSLRLGPPACNDPYADWHFVPVVGPAIGLGVGWSCIPDSIHADEFFVSGFASAVQIVGLGMLLGGLLRQIPDPPAISLVVDEQLALLRVTGRF